MPFLPEALKWRDTCPGFPCVHVERESNCFQTVIWQHRKEEKQHFYEHQPKKTSIYRLLQARKPV